MSGRRARARDSARPGVAPLLRDAAERGIRYLEGLDARSVAPAPDAIEGLARFDEPLPAGPSDPAEVLRMLDDVGSPATVAIAGGRFFGFVIGGALPVTVAANWLASAWDQNTSLWNITPGAAALEEVALSWMIELFGPRASQATGIDRSSEMLRLARVSSKRRESTRACARATCTPSRSPTIQPTA